MTKITTPDTSKIDELPYCIQGSEAPAFRGDFATGEHLICFAGCGHILIEHYAKDDYANIGIKCFRCGEITRTPSLMLGEVFSASTVTLGEKGVYLLGSTVNARSGVILTCDQEIKREIETTAPRGDTLPLIISAEGLKRLATQYDEIAGQQLALQRKRVERLGASSIKTFPFPWAIDHLEKCVLNGVVDIHQGETLTALMWLNMFRHVVAVWQHHPRFQVVARGLGLPRSFLHTSSQLIAAAYLFHAGNRIGLSLEDKPGEPNPDLYIRRAGPSNLFLEVKAPEALQWGGNDPISVDLIENAVKNCIKKSGGQINRSHHGILIISSSYMAEHFPALLEKTIQKALKSKGRDHKSLAAVVGLSPSVVEMTKQDDGSIKFNAEYHFSVTLNKHYAGENPVTTNC